MFQVGDKVVSFVGGEIQDEGEVVSTTTAIGADGVERVERVETLRRFSGLFFGPPAFWSRVSPGVNVWARTTSEGTTPSGKAAWTILAHAAESAKAERDEAVRAEREACAKVCEQDKTNADFWNPDSCPGEWFAAAIRARGAATE